MGFLKGVKGLIAFFTAIPVKADEDSLNGAATYMPLAPLFGALIGLIAGIFLVLARIFFPLLVTGILTLGFILLIEGARHIDGLLRFGDGVTLDGAPDKKMDAMRDASIGTGGFILGFVTLTVTALGMSSLGASRFLQDLMVIEISAKLAVVSVSWFGRPASQERSAQFIDRMRGKRRGLRLLASLMLSALLVVLIVGLAGIFVLLVGLLTSVIIAWLSNRHFGGITGDAFGAAHEIARTVSLVAVLATSA